MLSTTPHYLTITLKECCCGWASPPFLLPVVLLSSILAIFLKKLLIFYWSIGDKSWVFIGRTDAEAETPRLWPPHVKS